MDNKTAGIVVIVCLTIIEIFALSQGIDGVAMTGIVGSITAIAGAILGIKLYQKKTQ